MGEDGGGSRNEGRVRKVAQTSALFIPPTTTFNLFPRSLVTRKRIAEDVGMNLNRLALARCEQLLVRATQLHIAVLRDETGARIIDCGVHVPGGLEAGIGLAEVCMAGLGRVDLVPGDRDLWSGPAVAVRTDQPVTGELPVAITAHGVGPQVLEDVRATGAEVIDGTCPIVTRSQRWARRATPAQRR